MAFIITSKTRNRSNYKEGKRKDVKRELKDIKDSGERNSKAARDRFVEKTVDTFRQEVGLKDENA